jgi:hypothetical protein
MIEGVRFAQPAQLHAARSFQSLSARLRGPDCPEELRAFLSEAGLSYFLPHPSERTSPAEAGKV